MAQTKVKQTRSVLICALVLAAFATGAGPALAQAPAPVQGPAQSSVMSSDDFVMAIATLSTFSQRAGKLAQVLGQSNEVRRYGRDLADDQKTLQTLSQALAEARIDPPGLANLPANQADLLQTLHRTADRAFDRMFTDLQVQTQQEALAIVQAYAQSGDNPALKAAAAKLQPMFQQRLTQARSMQKAVG